MVDDFDDSLLKANELYRDLRQASEQLANAMNLHPDLAYEIGESHVLNSDNHDDLTSAQANAEILALVPSVFSKWAEAQEYMIHELMPETERRNLEEVEKQAYQGLEKNYRMLEAELAKLDRCLNRLNEATLGDQTPSYTLGGNLGLASD